MVDFNSQQGCPSQCYPGGWERAGVTKNCPDPLPENLASASLILIGTVHGDPRGYERVLRLLERLRPDVVTVEISRFSVRYRQVWERRWRKQLNAALTELPPWAAGHPAIKQVAAQISLPFEYRAARDYCRQQGIRCLPLDLGGLSRRHLPQYGKELLIPANLRALSAESQDSLEDAVAQEFRRARQALLRSPRRLPHQNSPETRRREFFVSRRLLRLTAEGGRVIHLGGWEHLVTWREEEGLRSWLAAQKPCIMLAEEADFPPTAEKEN